jgi:hypothetical protein
VSVDPASVREPALRSATGVARAERRSSISVHPDVVTISPKCYQIFGGSLRSDLDFPILPPAPAGAATTWTLHTTPAPAPECAAVPSIIEQLGESLSVSVARTSDGLRVVYTDTGAFDVTRDGRTITWYRPSDADEGNARLDIVGTLLPFALHLTDRLVLHGSSVAFEGGAVAFLAPSGTGKSTLAMGLTMAGARFLSDDAVPVRIAGDGAIAAPGVPSPRFREDSFARFSEMLPADAIPSSGKLSLSERLGDDLVETRETPLSAVYVLCPVPAGDGAGAARTAMPPIAATMALVQNAKLAKLLWGEEAERLLHLVAEVSRRVPVWTLDVPRDLDLLPGVVERLLEWHAVPEPQSA